MMENNNEEKILEEKVLTGNILTQDLINSVFDSVYRNKTVGGITLTKQDLTNVLYTIWTINSLEETDSTIGETNVQLEGYQIPKCFESLYVGPVTLTGTKDERKLLKWVVADDINGEVLTKRQMLDISQSLYSTQRKESVLIEVDNTNLQSVALFKPRFCVGSNVCVNFSVGEYPLEIDVDFLNPRFLGMDKSLAIDEFIVDVINKIKK